MKTQPCCPHCHSSQAVQPVATVVGSRVRVVYRAPPEQVPQIASRQTNLSHLLAPPRRPSGNPILLFLLAGLLMFSIPASCMLTMVFTAVQGNAMPATLFSSQAQRLFLLIVGIAGLLCITAVVFVAQWLERRQRPVVEQWQRQMTRWEQAWFCYQCHIVYVPGSSRSVAPEQMAEVLAN